MTAMPLHDPAHGNAPAQSAALARSILALRSEEHTSELQSH